MATIRKITLANKPSVFSNHVMVEKCPDGFLVSGASNVNQYVTRLNLPLIRNRDAALREAMAWAIEHALPEVFVLEPAEADQG